MQFFRDLKKVETSNYVLLFARNTCGRIECRVRLSTCRDKGTKAHLSSPLDSKKLTSRQWLWSEQTTKVSNCQVLKSPPNFADISPDSFELKNRVKNGHFNSLDWPLSRDRLWTDFFQMSELASSASTAICCGHIFAEILIHYQYYNCVLLRQLAMSHRPLLSRSGAQAAAHGKTHSPTGHMATYITVL